MKSLAVFLKDMRNTFKKPKVFIPIIVVLFIPVLYSGMFLDAFWDPYGKMDQLPVAVVNEDKGATYNDKALTVGENLVDELKKGKDFDWQFVSRDEAKKGMEDNKYYMTIIIPEDFSSKATTLTDDVPQPAQIIYEPNEGYNFLAGQIGGTAVKQIRAKVSAKVTESYAEAMLDKVGEVSDGLVKAGDGATKLNDGAVKIDDGVKKLKENLAKLEDGTSKLASGVAPLKEGVSKLNKGAGDLSNGVGTLSNGLTQLAGAGQKLQAGATQAQDGVQKLQAGLQSASEGASKLNAGLAASEEGSNKLAAGLEASVAGSEKVSAGAKSVAQGLEQLTKASPDLAKNPSVQKLLAASQAVAAGSEQVTQGQQQLLQGSKNLQAAQGQLHQGSQQLAQGQQALLQGATQLSDGQGKLVAGLTQFNSKLSEAAAGSNKLATGAGTLSGAINKMSQGMGTLTNGVTSIADGSKQLNSGAGKLKDATVKLTDGTDELATKLNDAATKTSEVKKSDAMVSMFAEPVKVKEQKYNEVPNYGTGFSPYFLSLGLFVGALIATLVVPTRSSSTQDATAWNRFVSRTLSFTLMSAVQAGLAALFVISVLGLEVKSVPMLYLFSFITSISFMFIIQALVTWLENPGRFIAILMLIFQLTTSAGTFPLELIPDWLKGFNKLLPMTYTVTGYKSIISSGQFSVAWHQVGVLLIFAAVGLALTLTYFITHHKNEEEDMSGEVVLNV